MVLCGRQGNPLLHESSVVPKMGTMVPEMLGRRLLGRNGSFRTWTAQIGLSELVERYVGRAIKGRKRM